jgi:hypothetical protein
MGKHVDRDIAMASDELFSDEAIRELSNPSRPQGITPEYIRTAQQCDFKWMTHGSTNVCLHECNAVLGEPHQHECIDCYTEYE